MTKQEIIDVLTAALELRKTEDMLPESINTDVRCSIVTAQTDLVTDLFDSVEVCRTVLDALRSTITPESDYADLIDENGMLKRTLDAVRTEKNAITMTANKRLDELTHLQREVEQLKTQLRAKEDELQHYKRQTLAAYMAVDEDPEDADTDDEPGEPEQALQVQRSTEGTAPAKKKRAVNGWHRWTDEEDAWIAAHLNSATNREVAEKFGVTPKAAYTRMLLVKERLGK